MFRGKLYTAIMAVVLTKIKEAEKVFKNRVQANKDDYRMDLLKAKGLLVQKNAVALEEAISSVIKGLI